MVCVKGNAEQKAKLSAKTWLFHAIFVHENI